MTAARRLAVCADDFGQDAGDAEVVARLAAEGRLTAVSCLVGGAAWPAAAARLRALPAGVARGLHLNFTEGEPVSPELRRLWPRLPSLPRLVGAAFSGRLPLQAMGVERRAQWDRFVDAVGAAPDFVDGHQHVHHLPGLRAPVVDAAAAAGVAVRHTGRVAGPGFAVKRGLIEATGGRALGRELERRGLALNRVLVGVYDFDPGRDYRRLVQRWLAALPADGALLFCHPGAGTAPGDAIAAARPREAAYLGGPDFAEDLAAAGVSLAPARRPSGG
jgi:predicted glycoside hydrolase/deacetylase ChbG (UPF0249 family)